MSEKKHRTGYTMRKFFYWFRDRLYPPKKFLEEAGLKNGDTLLDYGCGSGNYTFPASKLVGDEGRVYALDKDEVVIDEVEGIIKKKGCNNIQTIHTCCDTELPDLSVDVILLYDVYHHLDEPERILEEFKRVLKPDGVFSFSDHHMEHDEILAEMEGHNWEFTKSGKKTYTFIKG